jgi:TRAP-type uncharacterized transport system fused permease subunit
MSHVRGLKKEDILFVGGLLFALVQLVLPVFVYLIDLQLRSIHVGLGLSLALVAFPFKKTVHRETLSAWDLLIIGIIFVGSPSAA